MRSLRWGKGHAALTIGLPVALLRVVLPVMLAAAGLWIALTSPSCSRSKPPQAAFSVPPAPPPAPAKDSAAPDKAPEKKAPETKPAEADTAAKPSEPPPAMAPAPLAPTADKAPPPAMQPAAPAAPSMAKSAEMPSATPMEPPPAEKPNWMADYKNWPKATGYLISRSHGYRMVVIHGATKPAADIFRNNAQRTRHLEDRGFQNFPLGSALAMESWDINPDGSPGPAGPVFFMRKEVSGYDAGGGDWYYAMTRPNLDVIAEGKDSHLSACKSCHANARSTDFVPPADR